MPELPEVETVCRGIEPVLLGYKILHADLRRPDLRWPFPIDMAQRLTGARVINLRRRSKYILADLDRGETLLIHLGMSGRIRVHHENGVTNHGEWFHHQPQPKKHDHVVLDLDYPARLIFNDPRRFGALDLLDSATQEQHPLLSTIGPEPFGNDFHADYLCAKLKGKAAPIKNALLDQRIVAGLGNIYVCEILWHLGICPTKAAGKLSKPQLETLVLLTRQVLSAAIESGGSSLRDHRQADGSLGYFQHQFKAYGREGAACVNKDCTGIIKRIVQTGRSSFYCPKCQR